MVMSLNGKTTRGNESRVYQWTSEEDKTFFRSLAKRSNVFIMGRKTYLAAKTVLQMFPKTSRFFVLTKRIERRNNDPRFTFVNIDTRSLLRKLQKEHNPRAILLGGEETNSEFFKHNLIDELWITIEPVLFGDGKGLMGKMKLSQHLKLISVKRTNVLGTLFLRYIRI